MGMNLYNNGIYQQDIESAWKLGNFDKLEGSRILITGATGMIASVIIDILMYYNSIINISSQGIHILAISRNEEKARERFAPYWDSDFFTCFSHDISQPLPELGDIDYILHAASNTHPRAYATDPIGTITANVSGTYELLSYAAEHHCRRFLCFPLWKSMERTEKMWTSLGNLTWDILTVILSGLATRRVSGFQNLYAMLLRRRRNRIL